MERLIFLTGAQCGVDEQGVFVHRIRMRPPKAQGCRCGMAEVCGHMLTCPQTSLDTPRLGPCTLHVMHSSQPPAQKHQKLYCRIASRLTCSARCGWTLTCLTAPRKTCWLDRFSCRLHDVSQSYGCRLWLQEHVSFYMCGSNLCEGMPCPPWTAELQLEASA